MKKAELFKKEKNKQVRCLACCQRCLISPGKAGICGVRKNINGELFLLVYGLVAAEHIDPIEKKPLYHFLPKTRAYSIGTVGCNFKCLWCQNFDISQASKENKTGKIFGNKRTAEEIVDAALKSGCKSIAYTYNEPAIFSELVKDVASLAKQKGLCNVLVTNGYFTPESLQYLSGLIDAVNVDMKFFNGKAYTSYCGAKVKNILDNIKYFHKKGVHVEVTTLVIPGLNDSEKELTSIARFIASVSKDIPWHISRFFPVYKMLDRQITPISTLKLAEKIGKKYLKYVYVGNV